MFLTGLPGFKSLYPIKTETIIMWLLIHFTVL